MNLTTHHSPLTTHHSPLTTHHSPLTTHNYRLRILVTASRRLGRAVALAFGARGDAVAVTWYRHEEAARVLVSEIEASGGRALALQADLRDAAACTRVVDEAAAAFGGLDVLVNMASTYVSRPFDETTADDLREDLAVDLMATVTCSHAAVRHMRAGGFGRIVNVSDWVAASGRPRYRGFLGYYVAKSAVIAYTEALALEVARDGILVNAIAPGPILPIEGSSDEQQRKVLAATPLGRWGGGLEVARAVLALVDSAFITGETMRVDGGRGLE